MGEGGESGLTSLLYFSRAHAHTIENMAQVFPDILSVSQRINAKRDITGCLLGCNGWFMQLLEGPTENVQATYRSIERDARHQDLCLVKVAPARERRFPHWSMCGRNLSPADEAIVSVLERQSGFDPRRLNADRAVMLLQRVQGVQVKHGEDQIVLD